MADYLYKIHKYMKYVLRIYTNNKQQLIFNIIPKFQKSKDKKRKITFATNEERLQ